MRNDMERRERARRIRQTTADFNHHQPHVPHLNNGDESRYGCENYLASYSKGLPHNNLGEVDPAAYETLVAATQVGTPDYYQRVPLAADLGKNNKKTRFLTNPQAGHAFDLEGGDAHRYTIPPAPRFDSAEVAAEMVELYAMALARDVCFRDYGTDPLINDAVQALSQTSNYRGQGPAAGKVNAKNVFRGFTHGDLQGPYISQFLLRDIPYGTLCISQKQKTAATGRDYLTNYNDWLDVQRGENTTLDYNPCNNSTTGGAFENPRQYIRNLRDLATYVHYDALYEAYLNACLILLGSNAPFDKGNPYTYYDCANPYAEGTLLDPSKFPVICNARYHPMNQAGFATFGGPHILALVTEVSTRALKAVWHQKWNVHRRLRPEAFGGRVHNHMINAADYPIHADLLNSKVLTDTHTKFGTYLLPQAFAEGSPTHPAYGAGHATVAGACTTILKAWFDESHKLTGNVEASCDGANLNPYAGPDVLTVGGELDKVAANVSIGRNAAGVHYWTDYTASMALGEQIAIDILREQKLCYNEEFYFSLTKFDGTVIKI